MMKPKEKPTKLLWVDLEMTGLDAQVNRITEVAAIVTDIELNETATYESMVRHDEDSIRAQFDADPFWSKRGSQAEKIIQDMRSGKSEHDVEQDLITFVEKYFLPSESVYLAGNSIWNDRRFIDRWWPKLAERLHYRMLDVTSFKLWHVGHGGKEFVKAEQHRALSDIRESIAELRYYKIDN